ncbi:metallophosphoesterase [Tissierella sp. MSJ-40]|uniref:Phosphoesterase n=1 Tax=Tissierella simiarum TaxID=2841534 RepID=A0ABS6E0J5_9FIRM|nr:metallophosphoesterase [Tissierella simiarum]MBU5436415.1 metallophosphoesterase [Tissierella simiarum]
MKIIVVSDTHGYVKEFLEKVEEIGIPDMIFHLGDYADDGIKISKELGVEVLIVKGNGDYNVSKFNEDELVEIEGKKFFLTHGHRYNVRYNISSLYYKGKEVGADVVLFGHTHIPIVEKEDDITIINPGSPSMPRGFNRKKTFGLLNIGDTVDVKIIEIK